MTTSVDRDRVARRGLVRLLRRYVRPYLPRMGVVVLLQLVQTFALLYLPTLFANIVDNGIVPGDSAYIVRVGGLMLAVTLVQVVSAVMAVYFGARAALAVGRDLRAAIFDRVQELSAREVGRFGAPSLITRTTNDVSQVQGVILATLTIMVAAPIMGIGGVLLALYQDVSLSLLFLVSLPIIVVVAAVILRLMGPVSAWMQAQTDRINRIVREQIAGVRVIRAFVRDESERRRFRVANSELMDFALRLGRLQALIIPAIVLVMELSGAAILWFGGQRVAAGEMEIGGLLAFLAYSILILSATMMATFMLRMLPLARVCAKRIQEVLDTLPSVTPPTAPIRALPRPGHLDLRGVEFRYAGAEAPVLHGVDLTARPGQITAVVGSTGSGKTTLLNLVLRLYDPDRGTVRVGGVDLRELDPAVLVRSVAMVPQRPHLFTGTVASNLRYGDPAATDRDLWHALDVAQARDFVEAMPGRLEAPISQSGGNVSGGQRQRLAIARALVARPAIYLFDDAFSALDYVTDAALRTVLATEIGEATVVAVAARVSTIRDADRIVVLDRGRVVATGTHAELQESDRTYQEIVQSQPSEEREA